MTSNQSCVCKRVMICNENGGECSLEMFQCSDPLVFEIEFEACVVVNTV